MQDIVNNPFVKCGQNKWLLSVIFNFFINMLVTYETDQLAEILKEMASYIENTNEHDEKQYFFEQITQTELFHDAIGKIVDQNEDEVTVTTEY